MNTKKLSKRTLKPITENTMRITLRNYFWRKKASIHKIENLGSAGLPDFLIFYKGLTVFIELKIKLEFEPSQISLFSSQNQQIKPSNLCFLWCHQLGFYHMGTGKLQIVRVRASKSKYTNIEIINPTLYIGHIGNSLEEFDKYLQNITPCQ